MNPAIIKGKKVMPLAVNQSVIIENAALKRRSRQQNKVN
jgi:hypothetical protein